MTRFGPDWGPMAMLLVLAVLGCVALLWVISVAWTWKDADRRGQPGFIVAVVVALLFWPVSWIVWLLVRPEVKSPAGEADATSPGTGSRSGKGGKGALVTVVILVLVLLGGVGGLVAWDLMRKPDLRYWTEGSDRKGFLTVTSEPPGASVEIWVNPIPGAVKFRDGKYRINADFEGTAPLLIGETPVDRYELPTENKLNVEYAYGWLRGKRHKYSYIDCVYTIRVTKEGYQPKQLEGVTLTENNTATFHVALESK